MRSSWESTSSFVWGVCGGVGSDGLRVLDSGANDVDADATCCWSVTCCCSIATWPSNVLAGLELSSVRLERTRDEENVKEGVRFGQEHQGKSGARRREKEKCSAGEDLLKATGRFGQRQDRQAQDRTNKREVTGVG